MGEGKGLRAYIKRTFNVYQWAGGKSLIDTGHGIKGLFRAMTTAKKSARKETFSQAIVRLGLSPSDIDKKERQYKMASSIYGLFLVFGVIYTCLLLSRRDWGSGIMSVSYSFLMFGFFFRESFWYMQVKKRRLGMSVYEWVLFLMKVR